MRISEQLRAWPAWAREIFATAAEWNEFAAGVRTALLEIDFAGKLHAEEGYAEVALNGKPATLGLEHVARQCVASRDIEWTLATWADLILESAQTRAAHAELTWEQAAPLLRVQLYSARRRQGKNMIARELAPDLYMALVLDSEHSLSYVNEQLAAAWELSEDALFDRAMDNLYAALPVAPIDARLPRTLHVITGDDDYTAAAALLALPDYVPEESNGALVTLATKFTCSFIPLGDTLRSDAVQALLFGTANLFATGEGVLSPSLYWWRDHELVAIPVLDVGDASCVLWPDELTSMISDQPS